MQTKKSEAIVAKQSNNNSTNNSRNELIPIINSSDEQLLVDARLLHVKLQSKRDFSTWINQKIKDYGFVENKDFSPILGKTPKGGRPRIDYCLTLDMAKELAILERNEMGRKIRRYFIEAEKELQTKRLYGQNTTLTSLKKNRGISISYNGNSIYDYRMVQNALGYSTKSSLQNVRRCFDSQLIVLNRKSYVSEEYVKLMIVRSTARELAVDVKKQKSLVHPGFNQINLFQKEGGNA